MLQQYCVSLTEYKRLPTKEVKIGDLLLGNGHPIRVQTMTTTDTMDTTATVEQTIRCIKAGAELVRITAPSKKEAENLLNIKKELRARGYTTPLVADIHFTPNAAEIAARIVEKVRVNPGNYIDKKKFDFIDYTDDEYAAEVLRIRDRFTPLVRICREYGTAMRIGTNHGSLSDRIMSRYGDSPIGMVESAMEFLRIARDENYHQVILSMKSSNPQVMVQAYRLLINKMDEEFGECYPLHLGVTEAGSGEEGRIKSAIGIGALLEDGIGDTIRVSLTEDPELEIPVCRDIVARYENRPAVQSDPDQAITLPYNPFEYKRRDTVPVRNIGGQHVPVVIADIVTTDQQITPASLFDIGYTYDAALDKWHIGDAAADYVYTSDRAVAFPLPGTLNVMTNYSQWLKMDNKARHFPLMSLREYLQNSDAGLRFVLVHTSLHGRDTATWEPMVAKLTADAEAVILLQGSGATNMADCRNFIASLILSGVTNPVIVANLAEQTTADRDLIQFATETGALFLEGLGDGLMLVRQKPGDVMINNGLHAETISNKSFLNNTAFSILQATRTRISKTEYISCPSCGRTLFDLQETTAKIRMATNHLKGGEDRYHGVYSKWPR
jgi:(E)-4-hydroxy-3-methylbut-2-enyl-diphosphate synthase